MRNVNQNTNTSPTNSAIPVVRLTESFRFDDELASILTAFQYQNDNINLKSSQTRTLSRDIADTTSGLATVYDPDASLVFIVYDARGHRTANPIETQLTRVLINTLPLAESGGDESGSDGVSVGVVTPHNAQRGQLDTVLPDVVTANTVEKYQGGERDVMIVSSTVSDPTFARQEDTFILDARRLLVSISRSRIKTIVLCSSALFQVAPDSDQLDTGLTWNRLFLLTSPNENSAWSGSATDLASSKIDEDELSGVDLDIYLSSLKSK